MRDDTRPYCYACNGTGDSRTGMVCGNCNGTGYEPPEDYYQHEDDRLPDDWFD